MSSIAIFQIFYDEHSKKSLDSGFLPYDNSKVENSLFEYGVFSREWERQTIQKYDYTGFFSWKFFEKTKIKSAEVSRFMRASKDADIFLFNPFPDLALLFRNVWFAGEIQHPGLQNFAADIFLKLNFPFNVYEMVNDRSNTCYCNFWVGNEKFWNLYMSYAKEINAYLWKTDGAEKEFLLSEAGNYIGVNYYPFIMERLLSTILYYHPEIKNSAYIMNQTCEPIQALSDFSRQTLAEIKHLEVVDNIKNRFNFSNQNYFRDLILQITFLNNYFSRKEYRGILSIRFFIINKICRFFLFMLTKKIAKNLNAHNKKDKYA